MPQPRISMFALLLGFVILPVTVSAKDTPAPVWLLVTRPMFEDAVKPLAEARRDEGLDAIISATTIEAAIETLPRPPRFLLIVGDDEGTNTSSPWQVPAQHLDLYRWRNVQRMQYATDAKWTDRNDDGIPDFSVGRIPARTTKDVDVAVRKILDYEKQPASIRDLDLNVWSGSPLYGELINRMANGLLLSTVQSRSPKWVQPWILMGDPTQAFCGWPADQPARFLTRMRDGGLLNVFIGHGTWSGILAMVHDGRSIQLSVHSDLNGFNAGPPCAPLVMLTCDAGRFDGPHPSLAELLYFAPGGPVAVIAASTESHPLTNYFTGQQLLASLEGGPIRIGSLWLAAQRRAYTARDYVMEPVLRDVEGKLEANIDVNKLRRDQLLMYNLLGDPAMKLRLPQSLKVSITPDGDTWSWRVDRPARATRLEVAYRPSSVVLPGPTSLPGSRKAAEDALIAANRCFEFRPITSLDADRPWEGKITQSGTIRFVATGVDGVHVAIREAAPVPSKQASAAQK